ncbi:ATP-binding protein [Alkalihalobacillus sp. MEB130]|nr:ATP-binding protein [Alkalihalobacillus sp. MEB130]
MINDTSTHPVASKLEVTEGLNIKSFLGVPIVLKDGSIFGTLCAIATTQYSFLEKDIVLLQSMASFLAYYIELETSENLYRQLVEKSPDGIMVEKNGELIYANPATAEFFGRSTVGEKLSDIVLPGEDFGIVNRETQKTSIDVGSTKQQKLLQADGSFLNIETIEQPLSYKGEPATQIMIRDITYRKQVEDLINQSEKLSVAGQLAAGVAHEIRNPLTGIKGFIQLLKATAQENHRYFDVMMSEVERINEIVNEFLYLAKPEVHSLEKHDPLVLIEEVVMLLNTQAIMHNLQLQINFGSDIPEIKCESNQIKQVLINVIKNAMEVMTTGGEIYITAEKSEGNVKIVICDEGKGISKERLAHLGEPFYTTKEKGTGLGLMVSRKIIHEHNGSLSFASIINKGTTVTILLPIT